MARRSALGSGHFFRGVGVTIYEGYGLTETTAGICVNRPDSLRIGTVGQPVGGVTVRIADDGELLAKSPLVFKGYWHNEEATAEAIDPEGWFHTGDIGEIDDDGFVRITGRKKELIVTAGGKNVAPAVLEDRVRAHWLVSQCLVVGDQKPFIAALITLDPESLPPGSRTTASRRRHRSPTSRTIPSCTRRSSSRSTTRTRRSARPSRSASSPSCDNDWTEQDGQLTPSLKLKRNVVQSRSAPTQIARRCSPADEATSPAALRAADSVRRLASLVVSCTSRERSSLVVT